MHHKKKLHEKKIIEKLIKANNQSMYTTKLLQQCKSWAGPATSVSELEEILKLHPDNQEKIVRVELAYYRDTHKSEVLYNAELFNKINKIDHKERLTNFCVLLQGVNHHGEVKLPTNAEALNFLQGAIVLNNHDDEIKVNEMYITLWTEQNAVTWYLGYCMRKNPDGSFKIEHLERTNLASNSKWKNPLLPDVADVSIDEIFVSKIVGEWDVNKSHMLTYTLKNHEDLNRQIQ